MITDRAFYQLTNLESLCVHYLGTITDKAFLRLKKLQSLELYLCYQSAITDEAFRH